MPYFPPKISESITYIPGEVIIDAPIDVIWKVLLDFESYTEWNPFVRSQLVTDEKYNPLSPQPKPTEGAHLLMLTQIPPPKGTLVPVDKDLARTGGVITFVDEEKRRVGWKQTQYPDWLLRTNRWQELTEVEVDGKNMVKYWTVETFNGPLAWAIRWFFHEKLTTSFAAMATALKERSEQLARDE